MTIHKTKSGYVEIIGGEWRDGQMPRASPGVARLTVRHDQTNAVWKFTGTRRDAAETIGRLYVGTSERVARLNGSHVEIESVPDDFWRGKGAPNEDGEFDEFEPDTTRHPDVVAY